MITRKKWKLSLQEVRAILALCSANSYSHREIAESIGISHQSVGRYLSRIKESGLNVADVMKMSDDELEEILERGTPGPISENIAAIDFDLIDKELDSKHPPTRSVLWDEYKTSNPGSKCYSYSHFNSEIRKHRKESSLTMHIEHIPGDRCYIDYAGDKVPIYAFVDRDEVSFYAEIFVATLAYSAFSGVRACASGDLVSTINALEDILMEEFEGIPGRIVPDNMAVAVTAVKTKSSPAKINVTFLEFANHLGTMVSPARVRRPKDKATVEQMVGLVQREVIARFRHRRFYSLGELNSAIAIEMRRVNDLVVADYGASRRERFLESERRQLGPLPLLRFSFGIWSNVRARSNYHVKVDHNYYSVPWRFANETLRCKLGANTVEIYDRTTLVALHERSIGKGIYKTAEAHMPESHRCFARSNSFEGLMKQIADIGEKTEEFAKVVYNHIGKEGLALQSLTLIANVAKTYGSVETEDAARHALAIKATRASSLESILKSNSNHRDLSLQDTSPMAPHENLRGPSYFSIQDEGS